MGLACLLIASESEREPLVRVARRMPEGNVLVRLIDTVSATAAVFTLPCDATAEIVAREAPLVLADGTTRLVNWVRVHEGATGAMVARLSADGGSTIEHVELLPIEALLP